MRGAPGPQYNPKMRQDIENAPKYSFGHRRQVEGLSCIKPLISTPNIVGPGSYINQSLPDVRFSYYNIAKLKFYLNIHLLNRLENNSKMKITH